MRRDPFTNQNVPTRGDRHGLCDGLALADDGRGFADRGPGLVVDGLAVAMDGLGLALRGFWHFISFLQSMVLVLLSWNSARA